MSRLDRFKQAQRSPTAGHVAALHEIRDGRKRGHWIWYVLPQIEGLGSSPNARTFAIADREEAVEYLNDPELRTRLLEIVGAIAERLATGKPGSLRILMGSEIDALKTVSSLTLFGRVARQLAETEGTKEFSELARVADHVLSLARAEGFSACERTLRWLGGLPGT